MIEQGEGHADRGLSAAMDDLFDVALVVVLELVHAQQYGFARDGRDELQHFTGFQFVLHLDQERILGHVRHNARIFPLCQRRGVLVIMGIVGQATFVEGQRVAAVPDGLELAHVRLRIPVFRVGIIVIDRHAISAGDDGAVVFRLTAPFDLQAVDADFQILIQFRHDAQIARVQDVGPTPVFLDRHEFTGAAAFFQ